MFSTDNDLKMFWKKLTPCAVLTETVVVYTYNDLLTTITVHNKECMDKIKCPSFVYAIPATMLVERETSFHPSCEDLWQKMLFYKDRAKQALLALSTIFCQT